MRIAYASDSDVKNFEAVFMDQPCSVHSEKKLWSTLLSFVQNYLADFSSTIEEDSALLQSPLTYEHKMAITVRKEIKEILQHIKQLCILEIDNG
jgi:hypothetical protein